MIKMGKNLTSKQHREEKSLRYVRNVLRSKLMQVDVETIAEQEADLDPWLSEHEETGRVRAIKLEDDEHNLVMDRTLLKRVLDLDEEDDNEANNKILDALV